MKTVLCGDRQPAAHLELAKTPVVLSLEPYVGEATVALQGIPAFDRAVAYIDRGRGAEAVIVSSWSEVPRATFLLFLRHQGSFSLLFSLSHQDQLVSIEGAPDALVLNAVSGTSVAANQVRPALLYMSGDDLSGVVQKAMLQALQLTGGLGKASLDKVLPRWMNQLGLQLEGGKGTDQILEEVKQLLSDGYPLGFLLISCGWQSEAVVKNGANTLSGFQANEELYPGDLKELIGELNLLGVPHVGVCHPIMGAKGGVHPDLAKHYGLPPDRHGRHFLGYDMGRTFQFFHDYYNHLREQGVTFVKVVDQHSPFRFCRRGMDVTSLYKQLQTAIQAASGVHFHTSHFNGDCLINPNLFYWGSSEMVEVSSNNDIASSLQNSYWVQHLAQPDDGIWRGDDEATAIFHSLSGSHHLIDHGCEKIKRHLDRALLPDGTLLQPDRPLRETADSLFNDPIEESVATIAHTTKGPWGVVALFNLNKKEHSVMGRVGVKDHPELVERRYAFLSYRDGFVGIYGTDERVTVKLPPNGADVLTLAPIHHGVAVMGFAGYFLAPGPIIDVDIEEENVHISAVIGAPILLYCEHDVFEVRRNGETVPWEYDSQVCLLSIDSDENRLNEQANYTITFS